MSFIAVTYGYNQFSIFNTNVSTLCLIDNIISLTLEDILLNIETRLKSLTKEIEVFNIDIENVNKTIKKLEVDKQKEDEKLAEMQKNMTQVSKDKKASQTNLKSSTKNTNQIDINSLASDELKITEQKRQNIVLTLEKVNGKLTMLNEYKHKFEKIDKKEFKIDLVDGNGDRVNMLAKADSNANQYLIDRQCYELHRLYNSKYIKLIVIDEKNETVSEPLKIDGFCIRSLEDDIKWEEYEKTNKNVKKAKKK